jgi:hypothetical protein
MLDLNVRIKALLKDKQLYLHCLFLADSYSWISVLWNLYGVLEFTDDV